MMNKYDVIVVGAGLAGLTAAFELIRKGKKVILIEKEKFVGGRTASWNDNGMIVESGFHRHIGFYSELPKILKKAGINLNDVVMWEKEIEIKIPHQKSIVLGIAPFYSPIKLIKGMVVLNNLLSVQDKISLLRFFINGFKDYLLKPKELDQYSVINYGKKFKVTKKVIDYFLIPLSTGVFFLPVEEYSAKVFFGLFAPGVSRFLKLRLGAYLGGMGEILADPIANAFKKDGGKIKLDSEVTKLIIKDNKVMGVELKDKSKIYAENTILATDLNHAKKLLIDIAKYHSWFKPIINLPTMSAITIQFDLKEPSLPIDRTTFGPLTVLCSFTEQSRSTFKHVPGRLSVILSNPNKYMKLSDKEIYDMVIEEAKLIDIDLKNKVIDYRVIRHKNKFYHLGAKNDWMRPTQKTPLKGLTLAGDYTRQPLYATMEGAVISGIKAAKIIYKKKN